MKIDLNQIVEIILNWKENHLNDLSIENIYLFGSSIYQNGNKFDPKRSDIDLLLIIPENVKEPLDRVELLRKIKVKKEILENEFLLTLKKEESNKQIVSILPITELELKYNFHKGESRNFFETNAFLDITTNIKVSFNNIYSFSKCEKELLIQVFELIQKKRNLFLKNSPTKDYKELSWKGVDLIPKELARAYAKIASLEDENIDSGDEFNTSFGLDYLKSFLKENRTKEKFLEMYNWIDGRSGANSNFSNLTILNSLDHLFFYECLFEKAKLFILNEATYTLTIDKEFKAFLNDTEMLSKSHSTEATLFLEDIFVGPTLSEFDSAKKEIEEISYTAFLNQLENPKQIVISGESQSGKSALCKRLFIELHDKGFFPVYISDKERKLLGNLNNRIKESFCTQYGLESFPSKLEMENLIPIVDDFHLAKNKLKIIEELNKFSHQVIVVDDIFRINFSNESLLDTHISYRIGEFSPSLRNTLLEKWILLSDNQWKDQNDIYKEIDEKTELIDSALGKIIGKGIMPSYPFFILSFVSSHEAVSKPLDQNITTQGYFYQSLIFIYLKKLGVSNDDFESYINFLTEFSYKLYSIEKQAINENDFSDFIEDYKSIFNLIVPETELRKNLKLTNILNKNSFGEISFSYDYLFYFFIAKYLAENSLKQKEKIQNIIHNLHKDDNAYIAIFISHHDKNSDVLDEILVNAMTLFDEFSPAKLTKEELTSMDKNFDELVSAVIPEKLESPESVRKKRLERKDKIESKSVDSVLDDNEVEDVELLSELKRAIKTVEVIGRILKNRAGSLKFDQLEFMFREAMNLQLRLLTSFIDIIQDEESLEVIIDLVSKKLETYLEETSNNEEIKELKNDKNKLKNLVRRFFWGLAYSTIFALTDKIIHSLGSSKLNRIVEKVCNEENTPASNIIKQGIYMWYGKNLRIDEISDTLDDSEYSKTASNILRHMVFNYCQTHSLGYKERQKIEAKFGFKTNSFLLNPKK